VAGHLADVVTSSYRVAIIGAGNIAGFHVPALRQAGFEVTAVAARRGSTRVHEFARHHGIPNPFSDSAELLDARDLWDALVIAVPVEDTLAILEAALALGAPVLVEKPVSYRSADIAHLRFSDAPVLVGYNRRFYPTVGRARDEVGAGAPVLATLTLPESVQVPAGPDPTRRYLHNVYGNSVHGLDLARHVLGHLQLTGVERITNDDGNHLGVSATLRSERGDVLSFLGNWGTPANFALTVDRLGRRLELRPFELVTVYEGMDVIEPSPEIPLRQYRPRQVELMALAGDDLAYKPGFVAQARALAELCGGDRPTVGANLADAYEVLVLAEGLTGGPMGEIHATG
jgi:predicted dehydrogenase